MLKPYRVTWLMRQIRKSRLSLCLSKADCIPRSLVLRTGVSLLAASLLQVHQMMMAYVPGFRRGDLCDCPLPAVSLFHVAPRCPRFRGSTWAGLSDVVHLRQSGKRRTLKLNLRFVLVSREWNQAHSRLAAAVGFWMLNWNVVRGYPGSQASLGPTMKGS